MADALMDEDRIGTGFCSQHYGPANKTKGRWILSANKLQRRWICEDCWKIRANRKSTPR